EKNRYCLVTSGQRKHDTAITMSEPIARSAFSMLRTPPSMYFSPFIVIGGQIHGAEGVADFLLRSILPIFTVVQRGVSNFAECCQECCQITLPIHGSRFRLILSD